MSHNLTLHCATDRFNLYQLNTQETNKVLSNPNRRLQYCLYKEIVSSWNIQNNEHKFLLWEMETNDHFVALAKFLADNPDAKFGRT